MILKCNVLKHNTEVDSFTTIRSKAGTTPTFENFPIALLPLLA